MADIKIVNEQGEDIRENQPQEVETPPGIENGEGGDILRNEVAQLFNLDQNETRSYKNKLDTLIEYGKTKTDDHSPQGIKWALRSLGLKLGTPPLAEKLIEYTYRYAYLAMEGNRIDDEKQKFLNGVR